MVAVGLPALGLGWVLLCSAPVQTKLMAPLLEKALKIDRVRNLLTAS